MLVDGFQVVKVVKETGGSGAMVSDEEILDAIQLLASTEGIFTEPAGGTTLAATRQLVRRGVIKPRDRLSCSPVTSSVDLCKRSIVLCLSALAPLICARNPAAVASSSALEISYSRCA